MKRIKVKEVSTLCRIWDIDGLPVSTAMRILNEAIASIGNHEDAFINFDAEEGDIYVEYYRPETDAEMVQRKNMLARNRKRSKKLKDKRDASERKQYELLKKKFGG